MQVPGVPSPERKMRGQRYHLLQTAAKEIWYQQKNADGGDSRLQVPIPPIPPKVEINLRKAIRRHFWLNYLRET